MSMRNDMRNDMPDDMHRDRRDAGHHRRGSWMVPLAVLVALALGGLVYAFMGGGGDVASNQSAPGSTTGSGSGTGMTGEQTGAATTQTPRGAATGGGGAASR